MIVLICVLIAVTAMPCTSSASSGYRLQYSASDPTEIVGYVGTLPPTLEIPSGTTSIGYTAFRDCPDIRRVILPDSVSVIKGQYAGADGAFRNCANLEEVVFGSGIKEIWQSAFADCPKLRTINLPQGLSSIGPQAFQDCVQLQGIQIPSSVVSLGSNAFENTGITQAVVSNSALKTGIQIFRKCPDLVTAQFNGPELAFDAFGGCTSLRSVVIGDDVTKIEHHVFDRCTSLADVLIGRNVESIKNDCFNGCTSLKRIVLPERLRSIGPSVFKGCTQLEEIYIPASVVKISNDIIGGCRSLKRILFGGSSAQWDGIVANVDLGLKEMQDFEVIFNVPAPVVNIPPVFTLTVSSDGGTTYAAGIPIGTSNSYVNVADVIAALQLPEGAAARVTNAQGIQQASDAPVATGYVIEISGDINLPARITIVVQGDVLGDGRMSLSQLIALAQALTGQKPLAGPYLIAGDFNGSGKIDIADLVQEAALLG